MVFMVVKNLSHMQYTTTLHRKNVNVVATPQAGSNPLWALDIVVVTSTSTVHWLSYKSPSREFSFKYANLWRVHIIIINKKLSVHSSKTIKPIR